MNVKKGIYERFIKRILDCVVSFVALVILFPLLVIIAILVRIKLGSPVIFKQKRPGKNEKIFTMYKFRTMIDSRDKNGNLLPDDKRITKFGKALRASSGDELLELINILKGDMSIIGPRPQLVQDMIFMNCDQRRRHSVRQGLTGLAQINGRNTISWEEKLKLDLDYIDSGITFWKDMKIFIRTIEKVFKKSDVIREGTVSGMNFGDWLLMNQKISIEEYEAGKEKADEILRNC